MSYKIFPVRPDQLIIQINIRMVLQNTMSLLLVSLIFYFTFA